MRTLIQRVKKASVTIDGVVTASIEEGLLVFIGIESSDFEEDIIWLSNKITGLRIFDDENEVMNHSVKEAGGQILLVSQFTLHARVKKGFRPSYIDAAPADISIPIYQRFIIQLEKDFGQPVKTGDFGAEMEVALVNDGPVSIWIDTKNRY